MYNAADLAVSRIKIRKLQNRGEEVSEPLLRIAFLMEEVSSD